MPSIIEAPRYPNLHMFFKNQFNPNEQATREDEIIPKNVEKAEAAQTTATDTVHSENPKEDEHKVPVSVVDVNAKADDFISQKHKGFGLCKWVTMRAK